MRPMCVLPVLYPYALYITTPRVVCRHKGRIFRPELHYPITETSVEVGARVDRPKVKAL